MKTPELHGRILFEVIWSGNEPEWLGTSFLTSLFAATVHVFYVVIRDFKPA
jgi:hypothetical protein